MSGARPDPLASRTPTDNVLAKAAIIAVAAAVPSWLLEAAVLAVVLSVDGRPDWLTWFAPGPLLELGSTAVLSFAITVALERRGRFRADQWWAAGALFVLGDAAATVMVEAPASAEAAFVGLFASLLSGSWLVMFAAGAGAWHRLAPTFVPTSWTNPPLEDE